MKNMFFNFVKIQLIAGFFFKNDKLYANINYLAFIPLINFKKDILLQFL